MGQPSGHANDGKRIEETAKKWQRYHVDRRVHLDTLGLQ